MSILEQSVGISHPDYATSLNNLAALYKTQERYHEAETLYNKAIYILESSFGSSHPDYSITINNLAALYQIQVQKSIYIFLYLDKSIDS